MPNTFFSCLPYDAIVRCVSSRNDMRWHEILEEQEPGTTSEEKTVYKPCVLEEHKYVRIKIKNATETQCLKCDHLSRPHTVVPIQYLSGGVLPVAVPVYNNEEISYTTDERANNDPSGIPF